MRLLALLPLLAAFLLPAPAAAESAAALAAKAEAARPAWLPPSVAFYPDIAYGEDPLQRLDAYWRDGLSETPAPVLLFIHGGGWSRGDKRSERSDAKIRRFVSELGYVLLSANYRLDPALAYPQQPEDVAAALAWAQRNAARFGGDPRRVFLMGHSAGAHLASLAALDRPLLQAFGADPSSIAGVVSLDTAAYDLPALLAAPADSLAERAARKDYLPVWGGASAETLRLASPASRVDPARPAPPFLLVASRAPNHPEAAERFAQTLRAAGSEALVLPVGLSHRDVHERLGEPGPLTSAVELFLRERSAALRP